jgi:hypothetical protein
LEQRIFRVIEKPIDPDLPRLFEFWFFEKRNLYFKLNPAITN